MSKSKGELALDACYEAWKEVEQPVCHMACRFEEKGKFNVLIFPTVGPISEELKKAVFNHYLQVYNLNQDASNEDQGDSESSLDQLHEAE